MEKKEKKKKKEVDSWPGLIGLVKLTWRKLNALGNYLRIPMDMAEGMVWGSVTSSPSQFLTSSVQSKKFISARHKRVNQRQSWVAEGQGVERTPPKSFLTVGKRDELVVGPWALEVEISELSDQAGLCFSWCNLVSYMSQGALLPGIGTSGQCWSMNQQRLIHLHFYS